MSPEVEARKPYGAASDTYSLGCVLLEMLLQSQLRERRIAEVLALSKYTEYRRAQPPTCTPWRIPQFTPSAAAATARIAEVRGAAATLGSGASLTHTG